MSPAAFLLLALIVIWLLESNRLADIIRALQS